MLVRLEKEMARECLVLVFGDSGINNRKYDWRSVMAKDEPLLVTTKQGVFFGYGEPANEEHKTLRNGRMVVYWSKDVRGVVGLAATGPSKACRISTAAPEIVVRNVTLICRCSEEAAKAFEEAPWS